ncbi:MAG: bifunctional folylpolyglutamate synthase/dihydrofolate synthase [Alphaproteobacteria bacterium]|nr:bifunctional folylpolyglutamate synthase/dihydrofolate synthase [Alphaproteobacteria bacterium]
MSRTDAILRRLLALHPNKLIDLKLDRIERLLADLGRPQDVLPPVIHVAGTNGKGSTIAFLRAFLEAAGQRVHVYTSPNLVAFRERIRLAGTLVTARRLNAALERCEAVNAGKPITYFEITTAAAMLLFSEVEADFLLLEVGLGGRFDATNVIAHPRGTVIAPVSIDHVEFLGPELSGIAREKAGILKRGSRAVIGRQPDEALDVIDAEAARLGVVPFVAGRDFDGYGQRGRLVYQDENGLVDMPEPALAGPFQFDNAALAIAAARHFSLPVSEADIARGMRAVTWPARMQPLRTGKLRDLLPPGHELWLDGGHNEAGGAVLADALSALQARNPRPLVMIMGTFANKDARGYLRHFARLKPQMLTLRIPGERASWTARQLAEFAGELGFAAKPTRGISSALTEAARVDKARVVICGSLHLAGHVLGRNGTRLD